MQTGQRGTLRQRFLHKFRGGGHDGSTGGVERNDLLLGDAVLGEQVGAAESHSGNDGNDAEDEPGFAFHGWVVLSFAAEWRTFF